MRRALTFATALFTIAKLARLFVTSPRPDRLAEWERHVDAALALCDPARQTPRVDLVKWEQHGDDDPAGDLFDNDVAFCMALAADPGFAETLADIDELPEVGQ